MSPKNFAVAPVGGLNECSPGQSKDDYHRRCCSKPRSGLMDRCQVSSQPNCEQKQPDMREVGIAVGMTLFSNLNEANHWEKHHECGYQHWLGHEPRREQDSDQKVACHRRCACITNVCVQH